MFTFVAAHSFMSTTGLYVFWCMSALFIKIQMSASYYSENEQTVKASQLYIIAAKYAVRFILIYQ